MQFSAGTYVGKFEIGVCMFGYSRRCPTLSCNAYFPHAVVFGNTPDIRHKKLEVWTKSSCQSPMTVRDTTSPEHHTPKEKTRKSKG